MPSRQLVLLISGALEAEPPGLLPAALGPSLSDTGWRQVRQLARRLRSVPFDVLMSSDRLAAVQTARAIAGAQPGVLATERHAALRDPAAAWEALRSSVTACVGFVADPDVVREVVGLATGLSPDVFFVAPASISEIAVASDGIRLARLNDTAHLEAYY